MHTKTLCNFYTNFGIRKIDDVRNLQAKDVFHYGILFVKYPLLMFWKFKF
jgi:hypothetical protein